MQPFILQGSSQAALLEARSVASSLACQGPSAVARPCGVCLPCRQIEAGTYPYWFQVHPSGASDTIRVEQIRDLLRNLALGIGEEQYRIAVLVDAHRLREDSQGFLLKVLEEPPSRTVLFLLTEEPDSLLPTIRSRCQLRVIPEAGSLPDQADLELAKDVLWALRADGYPAVFEKAAFVSGSRKKKIGGFLSALEYVLRDGLVECLCSPAQAGVNAGSTMLDAYTGGASFLDALQKIWYAGYLMERNVNSLLVLETLFLHLSRSLPQI